MTTATQETKSPITRTIDHYSPSTGPWVRVEREDGTCETLKAIDPELLAWARAISPALDPVAARVALGRALLDPFASAPEVNRLLAEWRASEPRFQVTP